jgi:hypothetical protein
MTGPGRPRRYCSKACQLHHWHLLHPRSVVAVILAREFFIEFDQSSGVYYVNGERQEKGEELGRLLGALYRHARAQRPKQARR